MNAFLKLTKSKAKTMVIEEDKTLSVNLNPPQIKILATELQMRQV